jgi:flagellar hook-length control protein FliK
MMLQMPASLSDFADSVRGPGAQGAATTAETQADSGHPFALLLAVGPTAAPVKTLPTLPAALESDADNASADVAASAEELAAALLAAVESGKLLPPDGKLLPPGAHLRGAALNPQGQDAGAADGPLTRMLDMLRTLHGGAELQPVGDGEPLLLARPEARGLDAGDAARLLMAATQPATATATAAPAQAATATLAATGTAATTAPPSLPIGTPPGQAEWGEAVGQRVLWMVANKNQVAELRLNPPDLGPVEVKVRNDDDGVRLTFAAGNAAVREALESAAPRLREMFLAEGLNLANVDIGQRQAGAERDGAPGGVEAGDDASAGEAETDATAAVARTTPVGLVDLFV